MGTNSKSTLQKSKISCSKITPCKMKNLDMIVEAVQSLGERKGSTAKAIWKYLQTSHSESVRDLKMFRVQLQRISTIGKHVEKSGRGGGARYKLTSEFRKKLLRWTAKAEGAEKALPPMAMEHAITTKINNEKKAKSQLRKAAMKRNAQGRKALAKAKKLAATKAKLVKSKAKAAAKKAALKMKPKSTKAK